MSEHTPGPWGIIHAGGSRYQEDLYVTNQDAHGNTLLRARIIGRGEEAAANARMIAAAPEMLAMLQSFRAMLTASFNAKTFPELDALLVKIEGGEAK